MSNSKNMKKMPIHGLCLMIVCGLQAAEPVKSKAHPSDGKALSAAVASGNAVEVDDSALDEMRGESLKGMFKAAKDMGRAALSGNKAKVQEAKGNFKDEYKDTKATVKKTTADVVKSVIIVVNTPVKKGEEAVKQVGVMKKNATEFCHTTFETSKEQKECKKGVTDAIKMTVTTPNGYNNAGNSLFTGNKAGPPTNKTDAGGEFHDTRYGQAGASPRDYIPGGNPEKQKASVLIADRILMKEVETGSQDPTRSPRERGTDAAMSEFWKAKTAKELNNLAAHAGKDAQETAKFVETFDRQFVDPKVKEDMKKITEMFPNTETKAAVEQSSQSSSPSQPNQSQQQTQQQPVTKMLEKPRGQLIYRKR